MRNVVIACLWLSIILVGQNRVFATTYYENQGDITIDSTVYDTISLDMTNANPSTPTNLTIDNSGYIYYDLLLYAGSTVIMNDDSSVGGQLRARYDSSATLRDNASVGGIISVYNNATIDIYVTSLVIDNTPIYTDTSLGLEHGTFFDNSGYSYIYGDISGTTEDGEEFDFSWETHTTGVYEGTGEINIHVIPEPSTVGLLSLAAIALLRRKHRIHY